MADSSIQKKLKTFEDLITHADEMIKEFENGVNSIEEQFQSLKSSGNWNDPHASRFESARLNLYKNNINIVTAALKKAQDFLANKYETLKTHGQ